jgi:hypothetical protein
MSNRELIRTQIDSLPEVELEKVVDFLKNLRLKLGIYENDTEYLNSIPGMAESIIAGMNEPLSECVAVSEVWSDV